MKRASVRHRIEYALVASVRGLIRLLPESAARALGTSIGWTFYLVDGGHRRLAIAQLRMAFPTRSQAECRAIARATFAHFGRLLVALLQFSRLPPDGIRRRVEFEGLDRVREALSHGRGVLFFTGHFGFWELHAMAHALVPLLPPMAVLARALDNPLLHDLLEDARTRTGNRVIYRRGAVRRVLRALQANESVALLIDQHIQPADAVTVEFFGRPAVDDERAGDAGAAHGCDADSGVRAAARRRPLPDDLRRARRAPAGGFARSRPRSHAALHGRARDVRPPPSASLAVDAPALARNRGRDAGRARHVPVGRRGRTGACGMTPTDPATVRRVVVRPPNWLGDAVLALPAMAAIRRHFPAAHLTIAAAPGVAALFREDTGVEPDQVIELPAANARGDRGARAAARSISACCFRTPFDPRGSSGAPASRERWGYRDVGTRAGCSRAREPARAARERPASGGLLPRARPRPRHRVRRGAAGAGARRTASRERAPRAAGASAASRRRSRSSCFAPGAAYGQAKQWPPDRVADVIARLVREHGRRRA